ncbi:hypothetical protein PENTCL1PPCAC_23844, partial [Pristionchus entomophagus]
PRKKEKKGEVMSHPPADFKSGIIRFEVDNVSTLTFDGRNSPEIEVGGVYWRANFFNNDFGPALYLESMANHSTPWLIDIDAEFILVNSDSSKNVIISKTYSFGLDNEFWGPGDFISWVDANNEENGFINDDKMTAEIRFSITNMRGVRIAPRIDFTDPNDSRHDIALV